MAEEIWYPINGETGFRLRGVLQATKGATTNQAQVQWQVSLTNVFPAVSPNLVYDTLMRDPDDIDLGANWVDLYVERFGDKQGVRPFGARAGVTYYLSVRTKLAAGTVSAWATGVSFTFEAAPCSAAVFRAGA